MRNVFLSTILNKYHEKHKLIDIFQLKLKTTRYISVVVVYNLTIVAIGHGLLRKKTFYAATLMPTVNLTFSYGSNGD